jgi:hemolysin III
MSGYPDSMVEVAGGIPLPKPRLRGVLHKWAFFASLALGITLVILAPGGRGTLAAAIYAASVAALFGVSALYHRIDWQTAVARKRMRRLDHTMIFVLIAGSYTPFALLVLHGTLATAILIAVWAGAVGGALMKLLWIDAPGWLIALIYVLLGWVMVAAFPGMLDALGVAPTALVAAGGVLYTLGAGVYAFHRPDPVPAVFGYHEVFHALVIAAAALQYAVIAFFVLPNA